MIGPAAIRYDTEVSMARSKARRTLRFENLEARQLLSTAGRPMKNNTCFN